MPGAHPCANPPQGWPAPARRWPAFRHPLPFGGSVTFTMPALRPARAAEPRYLRRTRHADGRGGRGAVFFVICSVLGAHRRSSELAIRRRRCRACYRGPLLQRLLCCGLLLRGPAVCSSCMQCPAVLGVVLVGVIRNTKIQILAVKMDINNSLLCCACAVVASFLACVRLASNGQCKWKCSRPGADAATDVGCEGARRGR